MPNFLEVQKLPVELFYLPISPTLNIYAEDTPGKENFTTIKGYAAKFNVYSNLLLRYNFDKGEVEEVYHVIKPGAFSKIFAGDIDVIFTKNHDWMNVIGRYTRVNGNVTVETLKIMNDETGLYFETEVSTKSAYSNDLIENIKRKEISANSFSAIINEDLTEWGEYNGKRLKIINEFSELKDISPVVWSAFPQTELTLSSYKKHREESEETIKKSKEDKDIYYNNLKLKLKL